MQTTSDHPPAAADDAADRRPIDSPEDEATQDERIKRLPSDTELFLALAPEVQALFGPPPLIPGEDARAYETLLLAVAQAVEPKDVIEWLYVKDVADFTWEESAPEAAPDAICSAKRSGPVSATISSGPSARRARMPQRPRNSSPR